VGHGRTIGSHETRLRATAPTPDGRHALAARELHAATHSLSSETSDAGAPASEAGLASGTLGYIVAPEERIPTAHRSPVNTGSR
jgi:hypothetical protein